MWNPLASLPPSNALAPYAPTATTAPTGQFPLNPAAGQGAHMPGRGPRMFPGGPMGGGPMQPGDPAGGTGGPFQGLMGHFPWAGPHGAMGGGVGGMASPQGFQAALQAWRQQRPDIDFSQFMQAGGVGWGDMRQAMQGGGAGLPQGAQDAMQPYMDWRQARPTRADF